MDRRCRIPARNKQCLGCPEHQEKPKLSPLGKRGKAKPLTTSKESITTPKARDQALKYRRMRASNNISSKKWRDNKKKQDQLDDQYEKDLEERGCLMKTSVYILKECSRERKKQLKRILTDSPDCNQSPYMQRFVQVSQIKRGIDDYEQMWYHFKCQGWIAKDYQDIFALRRKHCGKGCKWQLLDFQITTQQ